LDAVEQTSLSTRKKTESIRTLLEETSKIAKGKLPSKVYSKELMELLFKQPYCKVQFIVDEGIAQRQTAAKYLKYPSFKITCRKTNKFRPTNLSCLNDQYVFRARDATTPTLSSTNLTRMTSTALYSFISYKGKTEEGIDYNTTRGLSIA
jgi:hypothetical protein